MGQSYSLTALSAGSAGIDVPELADLSYEKSLGDARFMKAIRARHENGLVVVKVIVKPYASLEFAPYIKAIRSERQILSDVPNALAWHRAFETTSGGYLVRQYVYSSIYDRMSTRPFLEDIEKRWLAFQLLNAVKDCHARDVYHGDIKTENTLVTSWNWLYLSDFSSSFKPTYLPEDNPADFSFYFDISGRRTCYLAPERFLGPGEKPQAGGEINWAMDIFSVGCVIAELFLESPIFSLSQLFNYKRHRYDPLHPLARIEDPDVRELVSHMIQLEPESRYSADEYLNFWRRKAFPEYFYSFLHQYMFLITDPSSGRTVVTAGKENLGELDERIDRVYFDFDKIAYFLDYDNNAQRPPPNLSSISLTSLIPLHLDLPNHRHIATPGPRRVTDDGTLLFLNLVTSALRSTARATARVRACELLLAFAERLTDEAKLDRVLPYVMDLLNDKADIVRVAALRTLAQLLCFVTAISPLNAYLFPEYILPRLETFATQSGTRPIPLVRATYAACLATLAQTAAHSLDVTQALKAEGSLPLSDPEAEHGLVYGTHQNLFDFARADLNKFFEIQTKALLTDTNAEVRRAFLASVTSLCVFFGSTKANDVILSHLNTYLNDRDWKLRCAFFEIIVGVATYVGGTNLEEFILPLLTQALVDPEETVVEKAIQSLASMAQLGLFQRATTWQLIDLIGRFTMHPNIWIRESAANFLSSATKFITVADVQCLVRPLVDPYFRIPPKTFSETDLLEFLKEPLPRLVLDLAMTWASNSRNSTFWKPARRKSFSTSGNDPNPLISGKDLSRQLLSRDLKTEEDLQWIAKLKSAGLTSDHEVKLLALRHYIWRSAQARSKEDSNPESKGFNSIIRLQELGIAAQTVFFEHEGESLGDAPSQTRKLDGVEEQPQTIADALLDASTNLGESESINSMETSDPKPRKIPDGRPPNGEAIAHIDSPQIPASISSSPGQRAGALALLGKNPSDFKKRSQEQNADGNESHNDESNQLLSPTTSIQRKGSAMDLLQRKQSATKAYPEISTSAENATGQVDRSYGHDTNRKSPLMMAHETKKIYPDKIHHQSGHTYRGHDPSVLKLLDALYLDNYPIEAIEFGPQVIPIERRQWDKKPDANNSRHWRPEGVLVATFGEHTGAISRVIVAPDHSFFITGSDDGTVRIWDCARLERNLAHRSRQTYKHAPDAKITSLAFIENTHCFISTGSDGTVHVVKVDFNESTQGTTKYGKLKVLREWRVPDEGRKVDSNARKAHAVWCQHIKTENHSVLLVATNTSQVHALDLKTMSVLYTLENPPDHGAPTCFCVDTNSHWLLLGTTHGILDLWDLRFRLRLRAWGFPAASPIHRLVLHPVRGSKKKQVCIAGGTGNGEVTVWDLEKVACREVYRIVSPNTRSSSATAGGGIARDTFKPYTPWYIDSERPGAMLSRFATSVEPLLSNNPGSSGVVDCGIRALAVAARPTAEAQDRRHGIFVAAGSDRRVRFWDMEQVERSCVVSGLEGGEAQPSFNETGFGSDVVIYSCVERGLFGEDDGSRTRDRGSGKGISTRKRNSGGGETKLPRSTLISLQQQQLLRSHLDAVTDVALVEYPFAMVVSVDRSGIVYVFR